MRVLVVGGGVVGLSSAYFLARRGVDVTLVTREEAGAGASVDNAGILALGHPPLPRPGLLREALRLLLDRRGPLYIPPRLDRSLIPWLFRFRRACNEETYTRSIALLARIGWEAGACFQEMVETEGIEAGYRPTGWFEVVAERDGLEQGRRGAERLRRYGYDVEELSGDQLRSREPAFREGVAGAFHYRDSAFADPDLFIRGLAQAAARHGARILEGTEATAILVRDGRIAGVAIRGGERIDADGVVLAAGVWTSRLAATVGLGVPLQAGKGYRIDLSEIPCRPSTACVLSETFVAVTPLGTRIRLAGTVELSGINLRRNRTRLEQLLRGARRYLKGLDRPRIESIACGLRPLTADGLPVVGWAPGIEGIYLATGHAMMGFLLGPLTGRLASESILDGRPSIPIDELSPARLYGERRRR